MTDLIKRINELAKKSREEGLTDKEKEEQAILRREYIDMIKGQVKSQLDNVEFTDSTPKS